MEKLKNVIANWIETPLQRVRLARKESINNNKKKGERRGDPIVLTLNRTLQLQTALASSLNWESAAGIHPPHRPSQLCDSTSTRLCSRTARTATTSPTLLPAIPIGVDPKSFCNPSIFAIEWREKLKPRSVIHPELPWWAFACYTSKGVYTNHNAGTLSGGGTLDGIEGRGNGRARFHTGLSCPNLPWTLRG